MRARAAILGAAPVPPQPQAEAPEAETGTALALVMPTGTALAAAFAQPAVIDDILAKIEADARAEIFDLSTAKGRKACASAAYRVAQTKTALDDAGKQLGDEARKTIATIDLERRKLRDRLDDLKVEIRKPLTEWEAAEEARLAALRKRVEDTFSLDALPETVAALETAIELVEAVPLGDDWGEFWTAAAKGKEAYLAAARVKLKAAQDAAKAEAERQAMAAELERLRKAEADRIEADRLAAEKAEREAEAKRAEALRLIEEEAAEAAKKLAEERAEQERKEAAEKAEADRIAAVEAARVEEAQRAEREAAAERAAAAEREAALQRQVEEAERKAAEAAQAERDRIAEQERVEAAARAKREADEAHRARILTAIETALEPYCGLAIGRTLAAVMLEGKIPHVKVTL